MSVKVHYPHTCEQCLCFVVVVLSEASQLSQGSALGFNKNPHMKGFLLFASLTASVQCGLYLKVL